MQAEMSYGTPRPSYTASQKLYFTDYYIFSMFFFIFSTRKQGDITIRYSAFDSFHFSTSRQLVMVGFTCNILLRSVNSLNYPIMPHFPTRLKQHLRKAVSPTARCHFIILSRPIFHGGQDYASRNELRHS
jgi:hypothetical protein